MQSERGRIAMMFGSSAGIIYTLALIDFLFRARAFQTAGVPGAAASVESASRGAAAGGGAATGC
ncbi:MAG: hypothetical protein DMF96_01030 [Acidobacteria bacterium]|nr:MAG: hypothetical protein DMF96_01030 [Acidobacteriota bacterium]